jgi:CHAD domain-containing protein
MVYTEEPGRTCRLLKQAIRQQRKIDPMAFRLKRGKPVARALSRIVDDEFGAAVDDLETKDGEAENAVHSARKHLKKTRAVLRLFEKALGRDYSRFDARLRTVGRRLGPLRDADAMLQTMKGLHEHYPRLITPSLFRSVDRALTARKHRTASPQQSVRLLADASRTLRKTRKAVPAKIRRTARPRAMRGGIERGYRRARKEMARLSEEPEDLRFHAWRRRVKDHWYHMRLFEGLNGRAHARVRSLKQLETWLGDDHNLVVLRDTILEEPSRFGTEAAIAVVLGCIEKYQATLRRRSLKEGRRLFERPPSEFRHQLERWFRR